MIKYIATRRSLADQAKDAIMEGGEENYIRALDILAQTLDGGSGWVCTHVDPDLDADGSWCGTFCPEFGSFLARPTPLEAVSHGCDGHLRSWFTGCEWVDWTEGRCTGCGFPRDHRVHQSSGTGNNYNPPSCVRNQYAQHFNPLLVSKKGGQ